MGAPCEGACTLEDAVQLGLGRLESDAGSSTEEVGRALNTHVLRNSRTE